MKTIHLATKTLLSTTAFAFLFGIAPVHATTFDVTKPPFNAKGDGVTDDTAAIKLACSTAKAGDTVLFPANHMYANTGFTAQSINLLGQGASSVLIQTNPAGSAVVLTGTKPSMSLLTLLYRSTVATTANLPQAAGIWLNSADDATVQQVTVGATSADSFYASKSSGTLTNNKIYYQSMDVNNAGFDLVNCGIWKPYPGQANSYILDSLNVASNAIQVSGTGVLVRTGDAGIFENVIVGHNTQKGPGIKCVNASLIFPLVNTLKDLPAGGYVEQNPQYTGFNIPLTMGMSSTYTNCGPTNSAAVSSLNPGIFFVVADTLNNSPGDGYLLQNTNNNGWNDMFLVYNNMTGVGNNGYDIQKVDGAIVWGTIQNVGRAALALTPNYGAAIIDITAANCGLKDTHKNPLPGFDNAAIDIAKAATATVTVAQCTYTGLAVNGLDYFIYDPHAGTGSTGNSSGQSMLPSFLGP